MSKCVLYVEDHFNNMLLVKRIVQAEGHNFLTTADGESGWQMTLEMRPDLIFVDLRLPGEIDGFELIHRLKRHSELREIPAIVLTAYGHGEAEARAVAAGCDGFLHKPADILQIRAEIRRYLGLPLQRTAAPPAYHWPVS